MDTHGYRAELRAEEDGSWTAEVPELPGSVAAGFSPDEAVVELADAITAWLDAAKAENRPVPAPIEPDTDYSGRFVVRVGHSLHRALAVLAAREGVSLNSVCQTLLAYGVGRAEPPAWWLANREFGDLLAANKVRMVIVDASGSGSPARTLGTVATRMVGEGSLLPARRLYRSSQ